MDVVDYARRSFMLILKQKRIIEARKCNEHFLSWRDNQNNWSKDPQKMQKCPKRKNDKNWFRERFQRILQRSLFNRNASRRVNLDDA